MSAGSMWNWLLALTATGLLFVSPSLCAQTVEYIHTDALGTPIAVTNASRVVIERSEYEPYGKLLNRPLTDGPGFTGHVQDAATGMTYMQQRYYDPQIGRFLSVDPVTVNSGDMRHFNRYAYAYNNPYKFTDPDGRNPAAGAVIGCAVTGPACPAGAAVGALIGTGVLIVGGIIIYNQASDDNEASGSSNGPKIDTPESAREKAKEGAKPARGVSGQKGEMEKPGGQKGADEQFDGTDGSNERDLGGGRRVKELDGGMIETHPSSKSADYPPGTPTVKIQEKGKPPTTVRYPEEKK